MRFQKTYKIYNHVHAKCGTDLFPLKINGKKDECEIPTIIKNENDNRMKVCIIQSSTA